MNVDGEIPDEGTVARQGRASSFTRTPTTTSAATRSFMAPRSSVCAERISVKSHHCDGRSPAWPISYDDLEPYYTQAEQLYHVHGKRGEDPTEPSASAPYPHPGRQPRAAHSTIERRLRRARPKAIPHTARDSARRADTQQPASASAAIPATAIRVSCMRSLTRKSSASIRRYGYPNVTLLTNAYVERLETSAFGPRSGTG